MTEISRNETEWLITNLNHDQRLWLPTEEHLGQALLPDQFHVVREVLLEEAYHLVDGGEFLKLGQRHEQRDSPAAVLVRQCNHHEVAPRPNVQVLGRHCRGTGGSGWN